MKQTLLWLLLLTLVAVPGAFGAQTIQANPSSLTFNYQPGSTLPASQTVTLTAPDGTAPPSFTYTWTATPSVWFDVQADASHLLVALNPNRLGSLPINQYKGSITLTPGNGGDVLVIPVTLNVGVGSSSTLSLSPTAINFQYQNNNVYLSQNVLVSSSTSGTSFSITSNQSWLTVNTSIGFTPATVTVTANPGGLATGTYQGSITFTASDNSQISLPVTLSVGVTSNQLLVSPTTLNFSANVNGFSPAAQNVSVSSGNTSATTANASSNVTWLSVTPNSGFVLPNTLTVQPNISGLAAGNYTGTITVTGSDFTTSLITVNLAVNGLASGATTTVNGITPYYGTAGTQTFNVTFTDTQGTGNFKGYIWFGNGKPTDGQANSCEVEFNPATTPAQLRLLDNNGATWAGPLALGTSGVFLQNSQCTINMASSSESFSSQNTVTLNLNVTFAPSFTGERNIAIQAVNNAGATNSWAVFGTWYPYMAGNLVNWFRLYDPFSRSHFYTKDQNEYNFQSGVGGFTGEGSSGIVYNAPATRAGIQAVPYFRVVTLAGGPTSHLWTTDPNEYFTLIRNKSAYVGEGIAAFVFPTSGARPADTVPLYRLVYLPAGPLIHHWTDSLVEYNSLIAGGAWQGEGIAAYILPKGTNTLAAPVEVSSVSDRGIMAVVNSATNTEGAIAPGSRIRIVGRNFGPDSKVSIGGVPATVLSANETGMDVLVPQGISGDTTSVHVAGAGRGRKVGVRQASPALFTGDLFGVGQVVANNADGSRNSAETPAAKGSTVILHANGVGSDRSRIKVTFNGLPASVVGVEHAADGLAKIEVVVPTDLGFDRTVPVRIQVGQESSQEGVNFSVQP